MARRRSRAYHATAVPVIPDILSEHTDFHPTADWEAFLKRVPARWVVYLMTDADDTPVQLLCVKNLRASLKRRLGSEETVGPSRRVVYRDLVRRIYWRRVDSAFETDWLYYEAARALFPDTYTAMTGFRQAWWIHVNPDDTHPRYTRTNDPTAPGGACLGPLEDKHVAARLVQAIEGMFDLCRDYRILTQSPTAGPCAWRQMGKCVGPCDGSISLEAYRQLIHYSLQLLADPGGAAEAHELRMRSAAAALAFESAAKIKTFAEQFDRLTKGPYRYFRPLRQFVYLSLQHGPVAGSVKLFLITPGQIRPLPSLIAEPTESVELLRDLLDRAHAPTDPLDRVAVERISLVTHHLFSARSRGVLLHIDDVTDRTLARAYRDVLKQKQPADSDDEGVMKELQSL